MILIKALAGFLKLIIVSLISNAGRIYGNCLLMARHPGLKISFSASIAIQGTLIIDGLVNIGRFTRIIVPSGATLILMGDNYILDHVLISPLNRIVIGRGTSVQDGCHILGDVCISEHCLLAPRVFLSSGAHSFRGSANANIPPWFLIKLQDFLIPKDVAPIVIGADCWIGINSVLLPNTIVPRGCVVGANSVMKGHWTELYTIFAGVPARPIAKRWINHSRMIANHPWHE
jgi:acetyltransferase-like isoleucine patch superfamily enzyme